MQTAPLSLDERVAALVEGVRRILSVSLPLRPGMSEAMMALILRRLGGLARLFAPIAARAVSGAPPPACEPARRAAPRALYRFAPAEISVFGWLVVLDRTVAPFGEALLNLLDDPEMHALLVAAPRLGRVLRPFCWALNVEPPPVLRPPPRPPRRAHPIDAALARACPDPVSVNVAPKPPGWSEREYRAALVGREHRHGQFAGLSIEPPPKPA